jgi:hypothetical protein
VRRGVVVAVVALSAPAGAAEQELGARLGAQISATDTTPGGLRLGGVYLYRMTERTWSDSAAAFTFGAGGAECYIPRDGGFTCAHGIADGFSFQVASGLRWYPDLGGGDAQPYLRGGLGLGIVRFGADEVTGLAIPLFAGAGVRFAVTEKVTLSGEAQLDVGPALFNHDLSFQPYLAMTILFGVEISLEQSGSQEPAGSAP